MKTEAAQRQGASLDVNPNSIRKSAFDTAEDTATHNSAQATGLRIQRTQFTPTSNRFADARQVDEG